MGRELKRVALDFDWPLKQTWIGYLCPYAYHRCSMCDGSGLNAETKKLSDEWYDYLSPSGVGWRHSLTQEEVDALVSEGQLRDLENPTPKTVREWDRKTLGHDAINQWICVRVRATRLGFYGDCPLCKGEGQLWHTEEFKRLYEGWKGYEPPAGEGYQLWETTSEGSPVSPVFSSIEALCEWCADNATTFGSFKATAEEWRAMLDEGFVRHQEGRMVFI